MSNISTSRGTEKYVSCQPAKQVIRAGHQENKFFEITENSITSTAA